MKPLLCCFLAILIWGSCHRMPKWFDGELCEKFEYGRIETRRTLTPGDKSMLEKKGIAIKEFLFENHYLGIWHRKWNSKSTERLAIKSLVVNTVNDRIASGTTMEYIEKLSEEPGTCIVLVQTIGPVSKRVLEPFGEIQMTRDHMYRMKVKHSDLVDLLQFPCVRTFSILDENYKHD